MAYQVKNGILPHSGGWLDQPHLLCQAITYAQGMIRTEERANMGSIAGLLQGLGL